MTLEHCTVSEQRQLQSICIDMNDAQLSVNINERTAQKQVDSLFRETVKLHSLIEDAYEKDQARLILDTIHILVPYHMWKYLNYMRNTKPETFNDDPRFCAHSIRCIEGRRAYISWDEEIS